MAHHVNNAGPAMRVHGHELTRPNVYFQDPHAFVFKEQLVEIGGCHEGIERIRPGPHSGLPASLVHAHQTSRLPHSRIREPWTAQFARAVRTCSGSMVLSGGAGKVAKNSAMMPNAASNMLISKASV